jgi:predicted enzyme related to lactoylglutathione lyase
MGESADRIGSIVWRDLTVPHAEEISTFYAQVVGWQRSGQSMGDYDDYNMNRPEDGETVAGICHARGASANIPPQWLVYITVADVDASAAKCRELGGQVVDGPRDMGGKRFAVIQDPAGAVAALISP